MKIICTTSNRYLHIVPIFCYLFNKFWNKRGPFGDYTFYPVEIVGYERPPYELPSNFSFYSLGEQVGGKENFSNDLRRYFEQQDDYFIWTMEDTFLKAPVKIKELEFLISLTNGSLFQQCEGLRIGRIGLTNDSYKQYTEEFCMGPLPYKLYQTPELSEYRLSTQVSIWNRDYLLRYLTPDLSPWDFECQPKVKDEFRNLCIEPSDAPVIHNEGVRRFDLFKYNFEGIEDKVIEDMKKYKILS